MANLKELRNRITSIGSTMKITSAMKMVSAAKLKKAQDAIVQMRPYASKLTEILQKASSTLDNSENAYGEVRDGNRVRMVVISSNRGLCGGFNSSVVKKAKSYMEAHPVSTPLPQSEKRHTTRLNTIPVRLAATLSFGTTLLLKALSKKHKP